MDWGALLQTFGVSVTILFFLGWCVVRIATWIAPRIDKIIDRLIASVDQLAAMDKRIVIVEGRVETLWDFQLRRAKVEAVAKGIGTMNSPITINEEAKSWVGDLADQLRSFHRKVGKGMSESQLAEEIERRWGEELTKKLCVPHGLFQGACLLIAIEVAKEGKLEEVIQVTQEAVNARVA